METKRTNYFVVIQKCAITITLFWIVFTAVPLPKILEALKASDPKMLFFAFLAFNLSKIVSAYRLNGYLQTLDIHLKSVDTVIFYYIGMFYNLLLPGGISGDGYKIYLLNKTYNVPIKNLLKAILLDRISGAVIVVFFAGIFFYFTPFVSFSFYINLLIGFMTLAVLPMVYLINRYVFPAVNAIYFQSLFLGFIIQFFQILSAILILHALGVETNTALYIFLFLLSSLAVILPFTIGGAGLRELLFLYAGSQSLSDTSAGVTFALLFFLISSCASFIGALFSNPLDKQKV